MSKRLHEPEDTSRPPKRPKPDQASHASQPAEEIHYTRQLQDLLVFRQDGIQQLRHGIASFKAFLESILYHHDEDDRGRQLSILREFLDSQKPADPTDTEKPFLSQLWQAWSFANQNNNDHLASSLCAIFALTLRTLSSLLELREHGVLLCRTIVQHQHLRLIKRCHDAPKHKDFLISPSLRLLTELSSFDGGIFAREVYKRREQTFDTTTLRRNLGLFKTDVTEEEARRKPAIRTLTVRYVLTHLKYSTEGGKIDILKQRPLCSALFAHLRDDPADLVLELLRTTEQNVFKDKDLPRSGKAALLTQQHLERVTEIATRLDVSETAADFAFAWLTAVCTTPSYGILRESGWYPPGSTKVEHVADGAADSIDLGLDSLDFYDRADSFQVRNTTLQAWLGTLRPQSDLKERELVLSCFRAAPELVHAYFDGKGVQLDPKLTNTWIGYASFIFEVAALPVPTNLGLPEDQGLAEVPPQVSIMIDSILPKPLTHKVLTRCLNQSSDIITFFATRILVLAFRKFADVQAQLRTAAATASNSSLWEEASSRLADRFNSECPKIKDAINMFRQIPEDEEHILQREASARLLRCYYELTPLQALEEAFDVSGPLTAALLRAESQAPADAEVQAVRSMDLEHLLKIAQHSTGMRWFHSQGALKLSPLVTLLRLHSKQPQNGSIRGLIAEVLYDHYVLSKPTDDSTPSPLDALIANCVALGDDNDEAWLFLDDCLARLTRQPVKYLDSLDADVAQSSEGSTTSSLLLEVIKEQAPFAAERLRGSAHHCVMGWISSLLKLLASTSEDGPHLKQVAKQLTKLNGQKWSKLSIDPVQAIEAVRIQQTESAAPVLDGFNGVEEDHLPFNPPPTESQNHPELFRWQNKDLDIAIDDGDIDAVMLCLCSQYSEIRRQAMAQLNILSNKLETSDLESKDQLRILVGELLETYDYYVAQKGSPLPYLGGTFAARALHVLQDPTHYLYPKINRYMMKSPEWRVSKLPTYWLDHTILSQPDEDDAYWKEAQWVLDWLVDGLRTSDDMEILRKAGMFERVMAVCQSPSASERFVKMKVLELLFRAASLDANTLVTRAGCLAWLEMGGEGSVQRALKKHVLALAEKDRVNAWGGVDVVR